MTMTGKEHYIAMDYVRYLLAMGVVIAHFNYIMGTDMWWPVNSGTAVGVFFGLSGFLVCDTYLRKGNAKKYIMGRAKRIIPIYFAIVILSATLLCSVSEMETTAYFTHPDFWKYLLANLSFFNFIQPTLPGVFFDNIVPTVNGSLWTLKVEWSLYLSIPLFYWTVKRWKKNLLKLACIVYILSVIYKVALLYAYNKTGTAIYHTLSYQFIGQFTYFYAGVLFYHNLNFIRKHQLLIILFSSISSLACLHVMNGSTLWSIYMIHELLFPVCCVSFFLVICTADWKKIHLPRIPNLSYELYLVHFPIIQFIAHEYHLTSDKAYIFLVAEVIGMLIISQLLSKGIKRTLDWARTA